MNFFAPRLALNLDPLTPQVVRITGGSQCIQLEVILKEIFYSSGVHILNAL
jgi:hypothetical protein